MLDDSALDEMIARFAIEDGLVRPEEVEQARETLKAATTPATLTEILKARGALTPEQVERLVRRVKAPSPAPLPEQVRRAMEDPKRRVGKYVLLDEIGRGGMGIVHRAWDCTLERQVAIKCLPTSADAEALVRFRREAQTAAKLSHPNIVPVHEILDHEGALYVVMDLIVGKRLDEDAPDARRAATAIRDAALAIQAAHEKGFVHRDLKPANIMIDSSQRIWVLDFGLARSVSQGTTLTATGVVQGTPSYMSPEQATAAPYTALSDVYSLGATLYDLLTGELPFKGPNPLDILHKIVHDDPVRPRLVRSSIPADLETITLKCLEKEPSRRYASAAALAADLTRFLQGEAVEARPPSLTYRWRKGLMNHKAVTGVALAGILLSAGVALAFVPRWRAEVREVARMRELRERLKPLEDAIRDARPHFYIEGLDTFRAKMKKVEAAIADLERLKEEPRFRGDPEIWSMLGLAWHFAGDGEKAEEALVTANRLAPGDGRVNVGLGRIYLERALTARLERMGETTAARRAAAGRWSRKAQERIDASGGGWEGAEEIDRHIVLAYRAVAAGDTAKALQLCEEGLSRFGNGLGSEEFWLLQGLLGSGAGARSACERALRRRPNYAWGHFALGTKQQADGDAKGAVESYTRAIAENPHFTDAYTNRALARFKLGEVEGAVADFAEAIRLDPGNPGLYCDRGVVRRRLGDTDGAVVDFTTAIRLDPREAKAYYYRGNAEQSRGQLEAAIADFTESIRVDPKDSEVYSNRGIARSMSGDADGAMADWSEAIRINPEDAEAWANRAGARKSKGDVDGAAADYTKALEVAPMQWKLRAAVEAELRSIER